MPPAPVPGMTNVVADEGDVFLYNTALWHTSGINSSPSPRSLPQPKTRHLPTATPSLPAWLNGLTDLSAVQALLYS